MGSIGPRWPLAPALRRHPAGRVPARGGSGRPKENDLVSMGEPTMSPTSQTPPLEMWAGIECTVHRLGDQYYGQLERNGHATRLDDLDRIAALGVRALRYPILWERTAPDGLPHADWSWADERLGRLRELGIRPIVGLVHHGSGPRHTSLADPSFVTGLAEFAQAVAERYPWLDCYTPVNEPLTTARFSGLYGHWYPHGRDSRTFAQALLNQCRAVVLSMQAIRRVNPAAQLVQTEDLGKTHSTPALAYQAARENERRWISLDLLCGRVGVDHPLWDFFHSAGVGAAELAWFQEHPCPPDIIGINHYMSSERFLDERLERYPVRTHGGNGQHTYADVEAVWVSEAGPVGPGVLLGEAWERYQRPIAVTEAHLGCTREGQLRWLQEVWQAAQDSRRAGADIRAVTVWSVFGAFDWNSLLTRFDDYYESGVFDVRAPQPRPTAVATMVRELAVNGSYSHPVLASPGWWRGPERLRYPAVRCCDGARASEEHRTTMRLKTARPIVIAGATGTLGQAFARLCDQRGLAYRLLTRREMDLTDAAAVERTLVTLQPWAVVNAAGYASVDTAEREPERCYRANADGAAILAATCARLRIKVLTFSSDLVFAGDQQTPYVESDPVAPLSVYGQSKADAEAQVLAALPAALVVRTGPCFGPWDEYNFVTRALTTLAAAQGSFAAALDQVVSPTYVPDLVNACLDLLIDDAAGLWHLANPGEVSWEVLTQHAAELAGLDPRRIQGVPSEALGLAARRPRYSVLGSERASLLPTLDDALARYQQECEVPRMPRKRPAVA